MQCNIGKTDRIIRIVAGIAIIGAGAAMGSWLGVIGIIPIGTALINFCPLYSLIGVDTGCSSK